MFENILRKTMKNHQKFENKADCKVQLGMPLKMCNNWGKSGVGKLLAQFFAAIKMEIISKYIQPIWGSNSLFFLNCHFDGQI